MNPPILFKSDDVIAIDKPAGLVVHPDGTTEEPALTDFLAREFPETIGVGEPMTLADGRVIERPGIVHRLDRETSGVLLVARSAKGFASLKEQFMGRTVKKGYNAFVYGTFKEKEGRIDRAIGKSASDFRLWSAQRGARGTLRPALTDYVVHEEGGGASFVEAFPQTGRTHQIRVHFKAIHHPVVCDRLYAPKQECLFGFTRTALHARWIAFALPDGTAVRLESPLPEDFETALELMRSAGEKD